MLEKQVMHNTFQRRPRLRGFGLSGCAIILLIVPGYFFIYPALTPNRVRGDFIDSAIVLQKDGTHRL